MTQLDWTKHLTGGRKHTFTTNEVILRPGMDREHFFVILQGRARIHLQHDQKELTLAYLKTEDIYVSHSRAWVSAESDLLIERWPLAQFKRLLSLEPMIALQVIQELGHLLHNTINVIEDLSFRSVSQRLSRALLLSSKHQQSESIDLPYNMQELAQQLGTSRQTLSTEFNQLIKQGLIKRLSRKKIKLLQPERLSNICEGFVS
ncbi:Crp/Fnr family transcriptional regulator [Agaribacterium sp. ZY112]|uniref:Crp/Fnr family transcriptional regulator n=1 Tax=Agaribacterium sp. ZY112 TaxID=3233574 RepID=UPI003523B065